DRPHRLRPPLPIHGVAFHEDAGHKIVAGPNVVEELVEEIPVPVSLPQVMVGVDDGELRIEYRLGRGLGQPGLVGRMDPAELRGSRRDAHKAECSLCGPLYWEEIERARR